MGVPWNEAVGLPRKTQGKRKEKHTEKHPKNGPGERFGLAWLFCSLTFLQKIKMFANRRTFAQNKTSKKNKDHLQMGGSKKKMHMGGWGKTTKTTTNQQTNKQPTNNNQQLPNLPSHLFHCLPKADGRLVEFQGSGIAQSFRHRCTVQCLGGGGRVQGVFFLF